MINKKHNELVVYQAANGAIELFVDAKTETIWATQKQIADIFDVKVPAVNKHVSNILEEDELDESTVSKKEIVQIEGDREIRRTITQTLILQPIQQPAAMLQK